MPQFGQAGAKQDEPQISLTGYSDGEIFRAWRHSIDQKGHKLGFMDFLPYKELSDEDMVAIIAYLRSLPPAPTTAKTGDSMNFVAR